MILTVMIDECHAASDTAGAPKKGVMDKVVSYSGTLKKP
jgi:hypothetical protein